MGWDGGYGGEGMVWRGMGCGVWGTCAFSYLSICLSIYLSVGASPMEVDGWWVYGMV